MATTVARLEAVLSASTKAFDRAIDRSQGKMHNTGKVAAVAGAAIAGGLAVGLEKSVHAAMDAQTTTARLEVAFKTAHLEAGKYAKQVDVLEKSGRKLGFTDEETKTGLGSLLVATHNMRKASKDLSVAQDIARFKNTDLTSATKMLTMAMGGSQRAAKQLGLSVQAVTTEQDKAKHAFDGVKDAINAHFDALGKLTPAQEKEKQAQLDLAKVQYDGAKAVGQITDKQVTAQKVIDLVNQKLHGQSQAYAETAAGGMAKFHAETEHLEVAVGTKLLPALTKVLNKVTAFFEYLTAHPKVLKAFELGILAVASALVAAAAAQAAMNLAVLANPYVAATIAIIALGVGVGILYKRFKELRPVLEFAMETFLGIPLPLRLILAAMGGVQGAIDKLRGPVMKLADAFHTLKNWLDPVINAFKWLIDNAKKIGGVIGTVTGAIGKANPFGDADPNMFKNMFGGMGTGPKSVSPKLYDELSGANAMGLHLTSGYRPGAVTKHGTRSDHSYYPSRAIDVAGPPSRMASFFRWLIGQTDVKQAFYDPLGSIFGGALSSYREGGHSDHVHVATYDQGGYLRPGWNLAYNGTGAPEAVGGGTVNVYLPNYVGSKQEIVSVLQNWARQYRRQNGRSAF